MLTLCSYIIGYVIVYNGGYQDRDEVVSAVTTKVNGDSKYFLETYENIFVSMRTIESNNMIAGEGSSGDQLHGGGAGGGAEAVAPPLQQGLGRHRLRGNDEMMMGVVTMMMIMMMMRCRPWRTARCS